MEDITLPPVPREFRAVWVATVANIDWPSKPGIPTDQQKSELLDILDKCADLKLNAVIFQVRPQCDALYQSSLEPWSYYLTGQMGRAPDPLWDPLVFAVEEAHKRGIEMHVWFNPYRANHPANKSELSADHISKTQPDIVKQYGSYLWMDPGEPQTREHTLNVVLDVVKRYDIDGIHIDDYFYPYKEKNQDFPDEPSWKKYKASGGELERSDWRRESVNIFVKDFYTETKKIKPWVKVGISPFGIWRPGYPEGIKGLDQYEELYADARKWLLEGWVDYFTPQLYWELESAGQPYRPLLKWWTEQNPNGRHIWPGNFTSRVGDRWKSEEIIGQIMATRDQPGASGNVHFSMAAFSQNRDGLFDKLKAGPYAEQALIPAMPWLATEPFNVKPSLDAEREDDGTISMNWSLQSQQTAAWWVVYLQSGDIWSYVILPGGMTSYDLKPAEQLGTIDKIAVVAVDRCGQESPFVCVRLP